MFFKPNIKKTKILLSKYKFNIILILLIAVVFFALGHTVAFNEDINRVYVNRTNAQKLKVEGYSNEHKKLGKPSSLSDTWDLLSNSPHWKSFYQQYYGSQGLTFDMVKGYYARYPWLAGYFPPPQNIDVLEFDMDGDGQNEEAVMVSNDDGNHPPQEALIIKNDEIIFSAGNNTLQPHIMEAEDNNGFLLKWTSWDQVKNGQCCPTGHMLTQFTYKNGAFIPVSEKETQITEKWSEYSQKEMGVSFSYPSEWLVETNVESDTIYLHINSVVSNTEDNKTFYTIYIHKLGNPKQEGFEDLVFPENPYGKDRSSLYTKETRNGLTVYKTDRLISQSGTLHYFVTKNNKNFIDFNFFPYYPDHPVINQDKILIYTNKIIDSLSIN